MLNSLETDLENKEPILLINYNHIVKENIKKKFARDLNLVCMINSINIGLHIRKFPGWISPTPRGFDAHKSLWLIKLLE